mgnify:CR=1 FL=1
MLNTLIALDERVFYFFHNWAHFLLGLWKWIAILGVYTIPLVLVWFWLARRREPALLAFIAGIFAWFGLNNIIGHYVVRMRPTALIDLNFPAHEFLFDRPGPSFPSDHAAFMTAVMVSFFLAGERRDQPSRQGRTRADSARRELPTRHVPLRRARHGGQRLGMV